MDAFLEASRAFHVAERMIEFATGVPPRRDDLGLPMPEAQGVGAQATDPVG